MTCPLCHGVFQVDRAHAGGDVQCPVCTQTVRLPQQLETAATDTAPPTSETPSAVESAQPAHSFPAPPPMPGDQPLPLKSPVEQLPPAPPAALSTSPASDAPPIPDAVPPVAQAPPADAESKLPRMTCGTCEHLFRVPMDAAGSQVYCPSCNAIVEVPSVLVETVETTNVDEVIAPEFQFQEGDQSAEEGGVRHLSREERATVRARRNAIMLVAGFLLLFSSIFVFQHYENVLMDIWERIGPAEEEEKSNEQ